MLITRMVAVACLAVAIPTVASAQTFLIDYERGTGFSNPPSLGGVWNVVISSDERALVESGGDDIGVTIEIDGFMYPSSPADQGVWLSGDLDWIDGQATRDYFSGSSEQVQTITIRGLFPGGTYRFDHLAARNTTNTSLVTADYRLNGEFAPQAPTGDDFNAATNGWDNAEVITWPVVTPRANGTITLTISAESGQFGYATAGRLVRLEQVPNLTPGGAFVLVVASSLIGLFAMRRGIRAQV